MSTPDSYAYSKALANRFGSNNIAYVDFMSNDRAHPPVQISAALPDIEIPRAVSIGTGAVALSIGATLMPQAALAVERAPLQAAAVAPSVAAGAESIVNIKAAMNTAGASAAPQAPDSEVTVARTAFQRQPQHRIDARGAFDLAPDVAAAAGTRFDEVYQAHQVTGAHPVIEQPALKLASAQTPIYDAYGQSDMTVLDTVQARLAGPQKIFKEAVGLLDAAGGTAASTISAVTNITKTFDRPADDRVSLPSREADIEIIETGAQTAPAVVELPAVQHVAKLTHAFPKLTDIDITPAFKDAVPFETAPEIPVEQAVAPLYETVQSLAQAAPPATVPAAAAPASSAVETSRMRQRVVQILEGELAAGVKETGGANRGIPATRYSSGRVEAWCSNFATWADMVAGAPLTGPVGVIDHRIPWTVNAVNLFKEMEKNPASGVKVYTDEQIEAGEYVPQPADYVFYKRGSNGNPVDHVNRVVGLSDGKTITTIGGNESNRVKKSTVRLNDPAIRLVINRFGGNQAAAPAPAPAPIESVSDVFSAVFSMAPPIVDEFIPMPSNDAAPSAEPIIPVEEWEFDEQEQDQPPVIISDEQSGVDGGTPPDPAVVQPPAPQPDTPVQDVTPTPSEAGLFSSAPPVQSTDVVFMPEAPQAVNTPSPTPYVEIPNDESWNDSNNGNNSQGNGNGSGHEGNGNKGGNGNGDGNGNADAPVQPDTTPAPAETPPAPPPEAAQVPAGMPEVAKIVTPSVVQAMMPNTPADKVEECYTRLMTALEKRGQATKNMALYMFATEQVETGGRCEPLEEYGHGGGRHGNYYGRGDVQLTHLTNYQAASEAVGVDLVSHPERALDPQVSADVMAWFLTSQGRGERIENAMANGDLTKARIVVNGKNPDTGLPNGLDEFVESMEAGMAAIDGGGY